MDAPNPPKYTISSRFYFEDLYIVVENTLFKVVRKDFEQSSAVFKTMFQLPSGDHRPDGASPEQPLVLAGVSSADMETFLEAVYPSPSLDKLALTFGQWRTVYRLARMWEFSGLCERSLHCLDGLTTSQPIARILLYDEFDLDEEKWYMKPVMELIESEPGLTEKQAFKLGILRSMTISTLRGWNQARESDIFRRWESPRSTASRNLLFAHVRSTLLPPTIVSTPDT